MILDIGLGARGWGIVARYFDPQRSSLAGDNRLNEAFPTDEVVAKPQRSKGRVQNRSDELAQSAMGLSIGRLFLLR